MSGGADERAVLWRLDVSPGSVSQVADLAGHSGPVTHVQFAPGGDRILTVAGSRPRWIPPEPGGRAWLWDRSGALLATLDTLPEGGIQWAGFSPSGDRILSFGLGGTTQLWDAEGRLLASGENGSKARMFPGAFAPTGDLMVAPGLDRKVWLFDSTLRVVGELNGHDSQVISAHFSPDGRLLVTGCLDKTARLWEVMPSEMPEWRCHRGTIFHAVYSPDGTLVATNSDDRTARLWNPDGSLHAVLRGHSGPVSCVDFSPDGNTVLTSSEDKTTRTWDLDGDELQVFPHQDLVWYAAFSNRGDRIVTAGRSGGITVWDVERARPSCSFVAGSGARRAVFLPGDQRILVAGGATASIYTTEGELERVFGPHDNQVFWAEPSPSGEAVLTVSSGNSIRLWSRGGELLREFRGSTDVMASFSPDGRLIVSTSSDTARVWDLEGHVLSILRGHRGPVSSAVFSPDGRRILTSSEDGTVRTWLADTGDLLELAERRTIRDFTPLELARYSELLGLPGREAWDLVNQLRSELLLKSRVIARLAEARDLDEPVRETALRMAQTLEDLSPQEYNSSAWQALRDPGSSAEIYARGLELVEVACELEPRDANIQNTLGAAFYRNGRFEEALTALARSMELDPSGLHLSENLVFLAMARFRLGQTAEARRTLAELRTLLDRKSNEELDVLYSEAEALLGATEGK